MESERTVNLNDSNFLRQMSAAYSKFFNFYFNFCLIKFKLLALNRILSYRQEKREPNVVES